MRAEIPPLLLNLIVALCLGLASAAQASFCATAMADFFLKPTDERILNGATHSFAKRVLIHKFAAPHQQIAYVWLVEETYPFMRGYVSKRVYREVTVENISKVTVPRPLTSRNFAELIEPHATMVETKERARRRWTEEIYTALSEVTLRFGPDMVTNWTENEYTHELVSTIRQTHMAYGVDSDGNLVGDGDIVNELYGPVTGFRDPYAKNFKPDAPWEATLPPQINPFQHVLKNLRVSRTGYAYGGKYALGLDTEVGAYAVEENAADDLHTAAILESWLQMTRDSTRFSQYGDAFLKLGMRTLTYGDPYSQSIFRTQHRIKPQTSLILPSPGNTVSPTGEIPFAGTKFRLIGWSGADLINENKRILNGEHPRFNTELSNDRRISLFVPSRDYDTGLMGAFDAIFELFETKDDNTFVGAVSNLVYNLEILEKEPDAPEKLAKLAPRLEAVFDIALLGSAHDRAVYAFDTFDFFLNGMKHFVLRPKTIPKWIVRALLSKHLPDTPKSMGDKLILGELALNALYSAATSDKLDWNPEFLQPPDERFQKLEGALQKFLAAVPEVVGHDVYFRRLRTERARTHVAIMDLQKTITESELHSVIARAIKLFLATQPGIEKVD